MPKHWFEDSPSDALQRQAITQGVPILGSLYYLGVDALSPDPKPNQTEQDILDGIALRMEQIGEEVDALRGSQLTRAQIESGIKALTEEMDELEDRMEVVRSGIITRNQSDARVNEEQRSKENQQLDARYRENLKRYTDRIVKDFEEYKGAPASSADLFRLKGIARSVSKGGDATADQGILGSLRAGEAVYDWTLRGVPEYTGIQKLGPGITRQYVTPEQLQDVRERPPLTLADVGKPSDIRDPIVASALPSLAPESKRDTESIYQILQSLEAEGADSATIAMVQQEYTSAARGKRQQGQVPVPTEVLGMNRARINSMIKGHIENILFVNHAGQVEDEHIDAFINFVFDASNDIAGKDNGKDYTVEAEREIMLYALYGPEFAPERIRGAVAEAVKTNEYRDVSNAVSNGVVKTSPDGAVSKVTIYDVFQDSYGWTSPLEKRSEPQVMDVYDGLVSALKAAGVFPPVTTLDTREFLRDKSVQILLQGRTDATGEYGLDMDAFYLSIKDLVRTEALGIQDRGGIEVSMKQQRSADFLKGLSVEDQFRVAIQGTDVNPFYQGVALDRLKKKVFDANIAGEEVNIPQLSIEALEVVQKEGPAYMPEVTQEQRDRAVALGVDPAALSGTYPGRIATEGLLDLAQRKRQYQMLVDKRVEEQIASVGEVSPAEEAEIRSTIERTTPDPTGRMTASEAQAQADQAKEEAREFALTFPETAEEFRASRVATGLSEGEAMERQTGQSTREQMIEDYIATHRPEYKGERIITGEEWTRPFQRWDEEALEGEGGYVSTGRPEGESMTSYRRRVAEARASKTQIPPSERSSVPTLADVRKEAEAIFPESGSVSTTGVRMIEEEEPEPVPVPDVPQPPRVSGRTRRGRRILT